MRRGALSADQSLSLSDRATVESVFSRRPRRALIRRLHCRIPHRKPIPGPGRAAAARSCRSTHSKTRIKVPRNEIPAIPTVSAGMDRRSEHHGSAGREHYARQRVGCFPGPGEDGLRDNMDRTPTLTRCDQARHRGFLATMAGKAYDSRSSSTAPRRMPPIIAEQVRPQKEPLHDP